MISAILKGALFALKLIAFATIIFLFACIAILLTFLLISNPKTLLPDSKSKTTLALPLARERQHNSTQGIINDVLITHAPKQIKATKKQQTKTTKSTSEAPKRQPTKSMKLPRQQTKKPLIDVTSKELSGLKQISSPNKAQTSFISYEYVPIMVQPLYKTKRHCCTKCFYCFRKDV